MLRASHLRAMHRDVKFMDAKKERNTGEVTDRHPGERSGLMMKVKGRRGLSLSRQREVTALGRGATGWA